MKKQMRRVPMSVAATLALLASVLLLSASAASASSNGNAQGVTSNSIKVAFTYVQLGPVSSQLSLSEGDYVTSYRAVIDSINAHGGINGRKIVPYITAINPVSAAAAEATCTQLTEDDDVFAVVGVFLPDQFPCYLVTHRVPVLTITPVDPQDQQLAKAPWFSPELSENHLVPKEIDAFDKDKVFAHEKVAVVTQSADQPTMQQFVLPELKKDHVDVVQTAVNDVPLSDTVAFEQQWQLIAQKFQSAGANVVVAVGAAGESWPQELATLAAHGGNYMPRVVALDLVSLENYLENGQGYNPAVLKGAVVGASTPPTWTTWNQPAVKKCVQTIEAAHPSQAIFAPTPENVNKSPDPWIAAGISCQLVNLFADIAKAAGPTLNNQTFLRGGESLKTVNLPGSPTLHFGPNSLDGGGPIYLYSWDSSTKQFTYRLAPDSS